MKSEKTIRMKQVESGLYNIEIKGINNEILVQKKNIEFKAAIEVLKKYSEEKK